MILPKIIINSLHRSFGSVSKEDSKVIKSSLIIFKSTAKPEEDQSQGSGMETHLNEEPAWA